MVQALTPRRKAILDFIVEYSRKKGYPPSVREICSSQDIASPSTVQAHLRLLESEGYVQRDPTKPRALQVYYKSGTERDGDRHGASVRDEIAGVREVPVVGDVAAGTGVLADQNISELLPLPERFAGSGELFSLQVRGDSMIEAGILDGDYVVVRKQPYAENGEIVVAGVPGEEATVKSYTAQHGKVVLRPANSHMSPMILAPGDVTIYGKVVSLLRRL